MNSDNIAVPGLVYKALASPLNWNFTTVEQEHADNMVIPWPHGRVLGGSTAINGRIYVRAQRADYDAFEKLGNPGWNWDSLVQYSRKVCCLSVFSYGYRHLGFKLTAARTLFVVRERACAIR